MMSALIFLVPASGHTKVVNVKQFVIGSYGAHDHDFSILTWQGTNRGRYEVVRVDLLHWRSLLGGFNKWMVSIFFGWSRGLYPVDVRHQRIAVVAFHQKKHRHVWSVTHFNNWRLKSCGRVAVMPMARSYELMYVQIGAQITVPQECASFFVNLGY